MSFRQTHDAKLRGGLDLVEVPVKGSDVAAKPIQINYTPKNNLQRELRIIWPTAKVIFITGGPGTGKTAGAFGEALLDVYVRVKRRKIMIARSPIPKGPSLGYDPGSLDEKLVSWTEQFNDAMEGFTDGNITKFREHVERIDVARIQGRTVRDAVLIVDEASDLEFDALKNICTRVGRNGLVVLCGDPDQTNLKRRTENPFVRMMRYQETTPGVYILRADVKSDQLREGFIIDFLEACEWGERTDAEESSNERIL